MRIDPYLYFDGQCEAALRHYEQCLGGEIVYLMRYSESPLARQVPSEWGDRVYHATLSFGTQTLGAADTAPGDYRRPQGYSLMIGIDTLADADRIFEGLSERGSVQMPLQETHWARRFGVVTDQFGTPWMINCEAPA